MVDHQEHAAWLGVAPPLPRAPRSNPVEGPVGRPRVSTGPADLEEARLELNARCDAIEECYEFILAYAGQGLESDASGGKRAQIRESLVKCDRALTGLADFLTDF